MIGKEIELDFLHPEPVDDVFALKLESGVDEDGSPDELPVLGGGDVEVEVEGVLGVGVDAER